MITNAMSPSKPRSLPAARDKHSGNISSSKSTSADSVSPPRSFKVFHFISAFSQHSIKISGELETVESVGVVTDLLRSDFATRLERLLRDRAQGPPPRVVRAGDCFVLLSDFAEQTPQRHLRLRHKPKLLLISLLLLSKREQCNHRRSNAHLPAGHGSVCNK